MGSSSQHIESAPDARESLQGAEKAAAKAAAKSAAKSPTAFRTISEVANELNVPQHVLRFWESKFSQVKPLKRGGGRRYYRPEDIGLLRSIRNLLYSDGYTIKGVQRLLREGGVKSVMAGNRQGLSATPGVSGSGPARGSARAGAGTGGAANPVRSLSPGERRTLKVLLDDLESMRTLLHQVRDEKSGI